MVIESLPADFVPESMAVYAIYRAVHEELSAARLALQEAQNATLAAYGVFDRKAGATDAAVVDAQRRLRTAYDRACWFVEHKDALPQENVYDPFAQPVAPHKHVQILAGSLVKCAQCGDFWPCPAEREYQKRTAEL